MIAEPRHPPQSLPRTSRWHIVVAQGDVLVLAKPERTHEPIHNLFELPPFDADSR